MLRGLNRPWVCTVMFHSHQFNKACYFHCLSWSGRVPRQEEDGVFGDPLFPFFKFFGSKWLCGSFLIPSLYFSFFWLFFCRQTSTPPEEEEINLHSYFLLRTKECTGLLPWAHFPSLLEPSVCSMSLKQRPGRVLFPPHLVLLLFCVWFVSPLDAAPVLLKAVFTADAACWNHTEKLQGVSEFTCPTFQASVFNIEQCYALPGWGLCNWNATEKESPGQRVTQSLLSPHNPWGFNSFSIPSW